MKSVRRKSNLLIAFLFCILGCNTITLTGTPSPTPLPTWTVSPPPPTPTIAPVSQTSPPTETSLPTPTETLPSTPTPQFIFQGPGEVIVPILLYHHIGYSPSGSPYYISPEEFDKQMSLLAERGYKTISVELLVQAIHHGAELPAKPILLTFDDGGETVFENALPIMQRFGFTGTAYIVYNYIGAGLFMDREQIRALYDAGWEIGSHSVNHVELPARPGKQEEEIVASRSRLESYLDVPVRSFAYPFGAYDANSLHLVRYAGYAAAMGLGDESRQGLKNLFYLYRHSIMTETTLDKFADILPWQK